VRRSALALLLGAGVLSVTTPATAQVVVQTLDSVVANGTGTVALMDVDDVVVGRDFTFSGPRGADLRTCKQASGGFYCLDGGTVVKWTAVNSPSAPSSELACASLPGIDAGTSCTAFTVDSSGALWLAARRAGSGAVYRAVPAATCPDATWTKLGAYCAKALYASRPTVTDLDAYDANATAFQGAGVLGIEGGAAVAFYPQQVPASAAPVIFGDAAGWALGSGETLQSVTMQRIPVSATAASFMLAATSQGRVLQRKLEATSRTVVFDVPAERSANAPAVIPCTSGAAEYGVRVSPKSGFVYVSDRNYCEVLSLDPTTFASPRWLSTVASKGLVPAGSAVTAVDVPPRGLSVVTGYPLDLTSCSGSCTIANGASLLNVSVVDQANAGITVLQLRGIPDCRYADRFPADAIAARNLCASAPGVVEDVAGLGHPAGMRLNVTPLLPAAVTNLFDKSGRPPKGLPAMYVAPQYRAQPRNGYTFDALFVVPQPGVRYQGTFIGRFDVPVLEGSGRPRRCLPSEGATLQQWDVLTNVSEKFPTVAGRHVDRITNINCYNPSEAIEDRLSLLPYNLEVNPDTVGPTILSRKATLTVGNDAIFARLVQGLYGELQGVLNDYACKAVDGLDGDPTKVASTAPLNSSQCRTLASTLSNGRTKLDKCVLAAFQPKSSAGDENCQSYLSQLANFRSALPATTPPQDYANRVGELRTRASVIDYVSRTRFLPSIPAAGFCREAQTGCPNPWF
jgi:hypothetical protein